MTAADLYRRLTLRTRATVFGYKLVPFTVGHAILFDSLGVQSITTPGEVALAAWICSMPAHVADRRLNGRRASWWMRWIVWTRAEWMRDPEEVRKGVEVLSVYLDDQTRVAATQAKGEDGPQSGVPFCQRLRAVLLSRLNYSPETVDQTPYLQALWDYIAWAEMEGALTVPPDVDDETEAELIRKGEEFAAKIARGEITIPC